MILAFTCRSFFTLPILIRLVSPNVGYVNMHIHLFIHSYTQLLYWPLRTFQASVVSVIHLSWNYNWAVSQTTSKVVPIYCVGVTGEDGSPLLILILYRYSSSQSIYMHCPETDITTMVVAAVTLLLTRNVRFIHCGHGCQWEIILSSSCDMLAFPKWIRWVRETQRMNYSNSDDGRRIIWLFIVATSPLMIWQWRTLNLC